MASKFFQAGPDLVSILSRTEDADELLQHFQQFLDYLPYPFLEADSLISALKHASEPTQMPLIRLLELELLLFFSEKSIDVEKAESIFKELSYLSTTNALNPGSSTALTRVKYNDLYMDYQFFLSPKVKELRVADLLTKKINILSLISSNVGPTSPDHVIGHIKRKILVYYLLCDSDYRRKGVLKFLCEENTQNPDNLLEISTFFSRHEKLLHVQELQDLTPRLKTTFYPMNAIENIHGKALLVNHIGYNISKLPRFYSSISMARIRELLIGANLPIDVEELVFDMISSSKFTCKATIDQSTGYVYFREKAQKYGDFETHIRKVCELVDSISNSLEVDSK